jgi:16S rRNA (guanine1516-N2)-methyltransferase
LFQHPSNIAIIAEQLSEQHAAKNAARHLGLPLLPKPKPDTDIVLVFSNKRVYLKSTEKGAGAVEIDFTSGKSAHRRKFGGGKNQPLAKAVGLHKISTLKLLDATGGFASDAFVLANLGANVQIIEQSPILCFLIQHALEHAKSDNSIAHITQRMSLVNAHSIDYLSTLKDADRPDTIYMDPMYPNRQKSAAVKKGMQLLHQLIGADLCAEELLQAALKCANKRVVVKRPASAEPLNTHQLVGHSSSTNTRYDIYKPCNHSN